ncbi:unnamed protein product [Phytophthora lilii]|uniref:Unnamed protein product n=1 Tax=Phytophthora lilii TaxID=2077276 RepID=A0A9W6WP08_9STRA|nr:unnamed protein product [Phytophthora lilii]
MAMETATELPAATPPKPRRTFHIQLDGSSPAEINFKQLMIQSSRQEEPASSSTSPSNATSLATAPAPRKPPPTRPQRFNIIEHLEKRYGGGAVLNDGGDVGGGLDRRDDDDLYDSEDSFIDDTELQQNIEEVRGQTRVKTKHSGFFVNAGEEIETLEKEDNDCDDDRTGKAKRGRKRAVDGALRSFLDELPDAASDWQPDEVIVKNLEVLRTAVQECKWGRKRRKRGGELMLEFL